MNPSSDLCNRVVYNAKVLCKSNFWCIPSAFYLSKDGLGYLLTFQNMTPKKTLILLA